MAAYPQFSQVMRSEAKKLQRKQKCDDNCTHDHDDDAPTHGCCGYRALANQHKDLADLGGVDFVVEFELVDVQNEFEREHWEIGLEEKQALIPILKAQGDALFKSSQLTEASTKYFTAIAYHEAIKARYGAAPDEVAALYIPLLLNLSACKLKLGDFPAAIDHTTSVLDVDPNNVKALFRRGQAHMQRGRDLELAVEDLSRAHQLAAEDTLIASQLSAALSAQQDARKQQTLFRGMFQ
jgi:AH receptor-interacting protein